LIPTPIGNLGDMTFRAVETMKTVDLLFAEDTRVTMKLLMHFDIKTELKSYHEHNKASQTSLILTALQSGKSVGLCSDAGMPLVSDPGFEIAEAAFAGGFNVVALPGASAGITGLVMSGFRAHPHLFYGFLDAKSGKRQAELERLKTAPETLVFYEAPHRIKETLNDVWKVLGDRKAAIAREITKKFEEILRGRLSELILLEELQGEIVLIVEGYDGTAEIKCDLPIIQQVDDYIAAGFTKSDAMKKVAAQLSLTKSVVYKEYLQKSNTTE
jgi:16S rRNA (cytidine1402-2'-O)-methyltransferase